MKQINLIIDSLGGGGAEKNCISLANFLVEKNYKVKIITIKAIKSPYQNLISDKVEVILYNKKNILDSIFKLFIYLLKVDKEIIILSFSPAISCLLNFFKVIICKKIKIISRCINTISERSKFQEKNKKQKFLGYLIKKLYGRSNLIIAQSKDMKEDLVKQIKIDKEKIVVINNPCDIKLIHFMMEEKLSEEEEAIFRDKKTIINVGSLTAKKNQKFLIEIVKKLKDRGLKFNLVLLGEGKEKENLINYAKELDILSDVYFLGFKKNPYKYIKRADFFLLSSLVEGFPNVLLDALACGKVIFSTDCKSGPSEILEGISENGKIIQGKYGYLISLNNVIKIEDYLISELIKSIKDTKINKSYEKKSKEKIKKYSKDKILLRYLEKINELY